MIDWAISKTVMSMAAVALILLSIFFFSDLMKENQIADTVMQDIADQISERTDQVATFDGVIKHNITFQDSPDARGLVLPVHLDDENYRIIFTRGGVTVSHHSETRSSRFTDQVHLFDPEILSGSEITSQEMEDLDRTHYLLEIESGTDMVVENVGKIVDGQYVYLTFLYEVVSV